MFVHACMHASIHIIQTYALLSRTDLLNSGLVRQKSMKKQYRGKITTGHMGYSDTVTGPWSYALHDLAGAWPSSGSAIPVLRLATCKQSSGSQKVDEFLAIHVSKCRSARNKSQSAVRYLRKKYLDDRPRLSSRHLHEADYRRNSTLAT